MKITLESNTLRRAKNWVAGKLQRGREGQFPKETHMEELEVLAAKEFNTVEHREIRAELCPIISALVQRVANNITARSPIFLDKAGNEMEELKELWEKNYYNSLLNDVIQATRTHGFMVLETNITNLGEDRNWLVHDSTDIIRTVFKGHEIEKYEVLPLVEGGDKVAIIETIMQYDLFPKEVIHFYVGKFKLNRTGVAAIKPIWDNAVRYSEMIGAMSRYDARIGNGNVFLSVDAKSQKGEIARLKNAVRKANTKNVVVTKRSLEGIEPTIKWEGSTNRIDWEKDLGEVLKVISGATGLPIRWFIGDPKGAQSAAKEDRIAIWTTLKEIFEEYVPFIRKLFLKMEDGEAINASIKEIVFDDGGNLAEDKDEDFNKSEEELEEGNPKEKYEKNEKKEKL